MTRRLSLLFSIAAVVSPLSASEDLDEPIRIQLPALVNGDVNADWRLDVSDASALLRHLYLGGPEPAPMLCGRETVSAGNGDANGDGALDLSDAVYLLSHLYLGGPEPVPPCQAAGLGIGEGAGFTVRFMRTVAGPFVPTGPPKLQWVDDEGVSHTRRLPLVGPVTGDVTGTDYLLANSNVDLATGNGENWGTVVFETVIDGRSGVFEGHYEGPIVGGLVSNDFVAQGKGELKGMKIMGRTLPGTGAFDQEWILVTHE